MTGIYRTPYEDIVTAYQNTGSVWKAAKALGLAGQTVHERLVANGYPISGRRWSDEEDAELRALVTERIPLGEIANRLGRSYAGVACRMGELNVSLGKPNRHKKVPRGAGYDRVSIQKHLVAMEKSGLTATKYCRSNGLAIESFVQVVQKYWPERWAAYAAKVSGDVQKECPYCQSLFYPANGKQAYCARKCAADARVDSSYFGGRRRETIGLREGICQQCGREGIKGLSSHHVFGKENDPENLNLVALCQGCHQLVTLLGARDFVNDPVAWESLISLAWLRKNGSKIGQESGSRSLRVYVEMELSDEEDD